MRSFCFIFIVYVVLLLTQPCQDLAVAAGDKCGDDARNAVHIEQAQAEQPEGDDCSPFCVCSCCSHPVVNVKFTFGLTGGATVVTVHSNLIEYNDPHAATHLNSIWQPPKV